MSSTRVGWSSWGRLLCREARRYRERERQGTRKTSDRPAKRGTLGVGDLSACARLSPIQPLVQGEDVPRCTTAGTRNRNKARTQETTTGTIRE